MKESTVKLYDRVFLNRDFPEYNLKQGDVATFIDTVPAPEGLEAGYILEVFNALGESIDVVTVPKSAVGPLPSGLATAIQRRFSDIEDVEIPEIPREPIRTPPTF